MEKRKGQTTMFVIIAILIVAVAVLIYFFFPNILSIFSGEVEENPYTMIQSCLEDDVINTAEVLSLQGGSIDPEHYIVYNGENIEYLCYTNEYYKTCVMQQPLLKKHVEEEIYNEINSKIKECFDGVEESYKNKGYDVNLRRGGASVELLPKRIVVNFNHTMTVSKAGSENFDNFRVVVHNNLYELISITNSILNYEAEYGDSESTVYMDYYRDLKVEKKKQIEGSTIYILTDRNTGFKFQFASRSVAWPPGYGDVGPIQNE